MFDSHAIKFRNRPLYIQTVYLFIFLVVLATVGHFIPASGVLVVGVLVAVSMELTRLRYRENTVTITLIMFSTMTLLWGWVGPYFGIFARPLALLMFLAWGTYCINANAGPLQRHLSTSSIAVLVLAVVIQIQNSQQLVAPLLWGYDNSAHVPALSQVYRHGGFIYSGNLPIDFTFSNYVNGYPPLQQGTWAFILSIANIRMDGGYEVLGYFSFFFFGMGLLIISLIAQQWVTGLSRWFKGRSQKILFILVAMLITFSQASYVFWIGFPPFLWTCGIIIAITGIISKTENQIHRILIGLLGLTLVNYSYPLLSPVLIIVLLYELLKMSKSDFLYCWAQRKIIAPTVLLTGVLNIAVVLKSLNVRDYLDDSGGIQPIEFRNLMPIVAIVIVMGFVYRYSLKSVPVISITFLASTINFAALAIYFQLDQGTIPYYPQKAGYLSLILGLASMGVMLAGSPRFSKPKYINFVHLIAAGASVGALWFSVSNTSDPNYAKYGHVSTSMVWDQLKHNPPNPGRDCFNRAMDITKDIDSNSNKQTILFGQDDLSTRWINGVRGRLTDATYSLSIPVGQGIQTLPEILKGWFIQYPNTQLLILAPNPPIGLEAWSDKIEYRQFNCE